MWGQTMRDPHSESHAGDERRLCCMFALRSEGSRLKEEHHKDKPTLGLSSSAAAEFWNNRVIES